MFGTKNNLSPFRSQTWPSYFNPTYTYYQGFEHQKERQSFYPGQFYNPNWYGQNPMYQPSNYMQWNQSQPFNMSAFPQTNGSGMFSSGSKSNEYKHLFENPLQPKQQDSYMNQYNWNPYMNPYPTQGFATRPPSGFQSILNSFKNQDGTMDLNKMMNTAGQMVNVVNQVSGMVKGLGGIFKV